MALSMSVGRDCRTSSQYEYVIFEDEEVVTRQGFFTSYATAKRAGQKAAKAIYAEQWRVAPELPL